MLRVTSRIFFLFLFVFVFCVRAHSVHSGEICKYSKPICDARSVVFSISAFDPIASAVRIGRELLVASRHAIADEVEVRVKTKGNKLLIAEVVPTSYSGDIILLKVPGLPDGPNLTLAKVNLGEEIFSIGTDVSRKNIRVYRPGKVMFLPPKGKPLARLHHDAYSQPGNSGGAVVNASGQLVGIVTSGGDGRYEAIPAQAIESLQNQSGPRYRQVSMERGAAIRVCVLKLDEVRSKRRQKVTVEDIKAIATSCPRSQNRQLIDLAAQTLGLAGHMENSIEMFEGSLEEDPNALNSRIGLLVSLSLAGRYEDSLPHLRWLLDNNVVDLQVLRLAIQSGVWGGDRALAERAFLLLKKINPKIAPTAKRFLTSPPPRPKRQIR